MDTKVSGRHGKRSRQWKRQAARVVGAVGGCDGWVRWAGAVGGRRGKWWWAVETAGSESGRSGG